MVIKDSHGFWDALSPLEVAESPKIAKMLKPFSRPITDCYECGMEVPTLSCKCQKTKDIAIAALFLKRLLNDLRATWNLLLLGYTSQAGSVAAAAFENALITNCLAGNVQRAEKMWNHASGGSPWSVANLCKMYAYQSKQEDEKSGKVLSDQEYDAQAEMIYAQYQWLCKVKHPTLPCALHDALSVSLTGDEYMIMAAPDTRIEDLPNKAFILTVTILRVVEAIESFALARELDYDKPNVISWQKRFDSIVTNLDKAVDPIMKMPLPFDYTGRMFEKDNKAS
ncbi:MAG TPA: hypothetical protein VMX96_08190 [Dehalococcoidia bacterium]|nr:hypothetical protein [Dehalococcoidia bacterium]